MSSKRELPELTHLQFLVLDIIGTAKLRGREVREELKSRGVSKTGPAFYQMMARLEEAKFVVGDYSQEIIDGQIIKERCYKVLGSGFSALRQTRDFYAQFAGGQFNLSFA